MKLLGNISHLANSGKLIAKTTKTPPAGAFVFTNDKQKIGKVNSIFGPVKNPYVSVNIFRSVNRRDLKVDKVKNFLFLLKAKWKN